MEINYDKEEISSSGLVRINVGKVLSFVNFHCTDQALCIPTRYCFSSYDTVFSLLLYIVDHAEIRESEGNDIFYYVRKP